MRLKEFALEDFSLEEKGFQIEGEIIEILAVET
jgi:hypothetical protein